jgi:thiosulfate/3-mercaptopyruvate sulfurtransferase
MKTNRKILTILCLFWLLSIPTKTLAVNTIDAMVSATWLKAHQRDPGLKIIEMSDSSSFNFEGHIPGAVSTNKSDWRFQEPDGTLMHLSDNALQERIQNLGINDDDAVVIYYKGKNLNEVLGAHYLFWLFHRLGHTQVAMLNKGWHGWLEQNGEI